jgi:hypothetical protein
MKSRVGAGIRLLRRGGRIDRGAVKPPAPVDVAMDVPAGTPLELTLESAVSSETATPEQAVRARVAKPVVISGMTAIPEGSAVMGTVVSAERSGRVKGRASIAIRFHSVTVADTPYKITTARITRQAEATKGEDATKIGIGAGVGAAIGAIAGGKKGAAIGAGVGSGAGTGAVLATRGKEVTIPAGATVRTTIQETVRITAPCPDVRGQLLAASHLLLSRASLTQPVALALCRLTKPSFTLADDYNLQARSLRTTFGLPSSVLLSTVPSAPCCGSPISPLTALPLRHDRRPRRSAARDHGRDRPDCHVGRDEADRLVGIPRSPGFCFVDSACP